MTVIGSLAAIPLFVIAKAAMAAAQPALIEDNSAERLIGLSVQAMSFGSTSDEGVVQLLERTGADQMWDVTNLPLTSPTSLTDHFAKPNLTMPGFSDPRISDANFVMVSDSVRGIWTYHRIDASGQYLIGEVTLKDVDRDGQRDTLLTVYEPMSTVFAFPVTSGSVWADSSTQTFEFHGSPPVPVQTVVTLHTVQGWGTLIAPEGISPVVRIRSESLLTAADGETTRRQTVRLVAPIPEGLMDDAVYASGVEIVVDSAGAPISFSYVAHTVSRPVRTEPPDEIAKGFVLGPNYPNPFSHITIIPFQIERPSHVRISVFDMVGRRTDQLLDRVLSTGSHRVTWSAESAPNGVYRIVLETSAASDSRLVVVQR